ncbi:MAG: DUF5063 domain-containing protein [Candidatus Nanopelagicales bacterium]|jgi:hypothetical protein|nr:DUF5063 domain-containing protein [Candidatus Nanopelagicales bacterium]
MGEQELDRTVALVEDAPIEGAMAVLATPATALDDDLAQLADGMAGAAARFVHLVESVAAGVAEDQAIALLLLEVSDIMAIGARLGAIADVVPEGRYEPDAGAEPDIDRLRDALGARLAPIDAYVEVFDPYATPEFVPSRLSDDLCVIAADLLHGLAHHTAGRTLEGLWWWQTTYLASWGDAGSAALRALRSLVAHVRSGAPLEVGDAG